MQHNKVKRDGFSDYKTLRKDYKEILDLIKQSRQLVKQIEKGSKIWDNIFGWMIIMFFCTVFYTALKINNLHLSLQIVAITLAIGSGLIMLDNYLDLLYLEKNAA
jgi:hypothetical protein